MSLNNLGGLLDSIGEYEAARPYFEQALAIFEAQLGAAHPYTRTVRENHKILMDKIEGPADSP